MITREKKDADNLKKIERRVKSENKKILKKPDRLK